MVDKKLLPRVPPVLISNAYLNIPSEDCMNLPREFPTLHRDGYFVVNAGSKYPKSDPNCARKGKMSVDVRSYGLTLSEATRMIRVHTDCYPG